MATHDIKSKPEPDKVKPVVTGKVSKKKKGFIEGFIEEDAKTIASSIKNDVLVPTIKDLIANGIKMGVDMLLFGESSGGYSYHGPRKGGTAYNQMYTNRQVVSAGHKVQPRLRHDVEILTFDQRIDAELVLESLSDQMEKYHCFSIANYYQACKWPYEYTDDNYGWYTMEGISILHVPGGWTIDFPKPEPLNR